MSEILGHVSQGHAPVSQRTPTLGAGTLGAERVEWQIAVFCQNERSRIEACLASISAALGSRRGLVTVIINGSTDGSEAAAQAASEKIGTPIRIFSIPLADKSNAINTFLYDRQLRIDADLYFCIDGYVTIAPNSLNAIAARLTECPDALAASGVAMNGRTESYSTQKTVEVGGVLKGQFYALKPDFVDRMVSGGFRLPVGLYRGDGLLGSMIAHDLDPLKQPWTNSRIIGVAQAGFEINTLSPFRFKDLRRQFRRKIRQMRGRLENKAISRLIYAGGYAALPFFADDMIRDFLAVNPVPAISLWERPFMALALRHHRTTKMPDAASLRPYKVVEGPVSAASCEGVSL